MENILSWLKKWGETPTTLVAIIFSSISLAWNICSSWIYRSRLLTSIEYNLVVDGSNQTFSIIISLINLGKEPIFIKGIFAVPFTGEKDNMEVFCGGFPTREIQSNQMIRIDFPMTCWMFSPYKRIDVETTRGKIYSINKKALDALEKTILQERPNWPAEKEKLIQAYNKDKKANK